MILPLIVILLLNIEKKLMEYPAAFTVFSASPPKLFSKKSINIVCFAALIVSIFYFGCGMNKVHASSELQKLEYQGSKNERIVQIAQADADDIENIPGVDDTKAVINQINERAKESVKEQALLSEETHDPAVSISTERNAPGREAIRNFNLGVYYQKQGNTKEAVERYEMVLQQEPDNAEIHNNLGVIYKEQGNLDKAIEHFMHVVSLNPGMDESHNNLGVIHFLKGDQREAELEYRKALELNPRNLESQINLGLIYKAQGLDEQAIDAMEKVLSVEPFHSEAHYNLAILYERLGHLERAIWHYTRFVHNAGKRYSALAGNVTEHIENLKVVSGEVLKE